MICKLNCDRRETCTTYKNRTYCTTCYYWKHYQDNLWGCACGYFGDDLFNMSEDTCPPLACPGYRQLSNSQKG